VANEHESRLRSEAHCFELQASHILNETYARRLKAQLQVKEKKGSKKMKLVGDVHARMVTSDEFYKMAKDKEKEVRREARDKQERKEARLAYDAAVVEWELAKEERKAEVARIKEKSKKANDTYNKKKDAAKAKDKTFRGTKPIPIPKALDRPKLKDFLARAGAVPDEGKEEALGDSSEDED